MIKVSVIVPVYNVENYLRKCLDSLVSQTLKDIEIIVVNDGSQDNSQVIIDEYVKKYPSLLKSFIKENGGLSSARNYGLKFSNGEYISFVDSDDWLDLNALEEMYNKAKEDEADVVICDMVSHYNNYDDYKNCTKFNSVFEVTPSACNKIFKKDVVNNIKFLQGLWYEDLNFSFKIFFETSKISVINKGFYHCSCREGSITNNNNSLKNLDIITVIDDLKEYSKNKNIYDENLFSYLIFNHILITTINRVAVQKSKDKKMVLNTLIKYCHDNISDYKNMNFYKEIIKNRRIIACLNYHKLYNLSKIILKTKSLLKRGK